MVPPLIHTARGTSPNAPIDNSMLKIHKIYSLMAAVLAAEVFGLGGGDEDLFSLLTNAALFIDDLE